MPETPLENKVSFYMEAYKADMRGGRIDDFFSSKGELLYIPKDLELLFKGKNGVPVPTDWGKRVDKLLLTDGMEKTLFGAALFVKGKSFQLGQERKIFSPLYLLEARLDVLNEVYFLYIESYSINPAFTDFIKTMNGGEGPSLDELSKELPAQLSSFDDWIKLRNALQQKYPDLDVLAVEEMMEDNFDNSGLQRLSRKKGLDYRKIIPGIGFQVFPKPQGSRGVLSELNEISSKAEDSTLLKCIFDAQESTNKTKVKPVGIRIPASLSEAQQKIFQIVNREELSLLVGPPGTGKSFTIAALAADYISRGKSVLIASKNEQSGNVIANKIEQDFRLKGILVKTRKKTHKREMSSRMEKILGGIVQVSTKKECDFLEVQIFRINAEKRTILKELYKTSQMEMAWGGFFAEERLGFFDRFRFRRLESKLRYSKRLSSLYISLAKTEAKRLRVLRKFILKKYQLTLQEKLTEDRSDFYKLYDALGMEKGNMIQESFNTIDFKTVLKAFPAWVCQFANLSTNFPLKANLFDLLIIDEASQCDIATAIPALYRAKKVLVVGDPQQLRHMSFLSRAKELRLLEEFSIPNSYHSFRKLSILDLVNRSLKDQSQLAFLNEHYRSLPQIIGFSNKHFYNEQLDLLRNSKIDQNGEALELRAINGRRNEKGQNIEEASALVKEIRLLVDTEKSKKPSMCTSIGVLSPFTKQLNFLKKELRRHFTNNDFRRHKLLVGTPYHFQGEERDIMLLSFVLDDQSPMSSFAYLNKADVFNVSISRARDKQILFVSVKDKILPEEYLFGQYIDYVRNGVHSRSDEEKPSKVRDQFMKEILSVLGAFNADAILTDQSVAGVQVDILLLKGDKSLCIDLVGCPGDFKDIVSPLDIDRLGRLGHKLYIISYRNWKRYQKSATTSLGRFVERHS